MKSGKVDFQSSYRERLDGEQLPDFFLRLKKWGVTLDSLAFLCIGTDRSTGDSLGPLVGTMLTEAGYNNVIGTLQFPCDSSNLLERLQEIPQGSKVLAIDACLGQPLSVGKYLVSEGPIIPGQSVRQDLPPLGDYSLAAVVGANGPKPYSILQTTSLYQVMNMAETIVRAIRLNFH